MLVNIALFIQLFLYLLRRGWVASFYYITTDVRELRRLDEARLDEFVRVLRGAQIYGAGAQLSSSYKYYRH
jgi:hypothetical protein